MQQLPPSRQRLLLVVLRPEPKGQPRQQQRDPSPTRRHRRNPRRPPRIRRQQRVGQHRVHLVDALEGRVGQRLVQVGPVRVARGLAQPRPALAPDQLQVGLVLGVDPHHALGAAKAGVRDEASHRRGRREPVEPPGRLPPPHGHHAAPGRQVGHEGVDPALPHLVDGQIPAQAVQALGAAEAALFRYPAHRLHRVGEPAGARRAVPRRWPALHAGTDAREQVGHSVPKQAGGPGVTLRRQLVIQAAQGPAHGCHQVRVVVGIGEVAGELGPTTRRYVPARPRGPVDATAGALAVLAALDEAARPMGQQALDSSEHGTGEHPRRDLARRARNHGGTAQGWLRRESSGPEHGPQRAPAKARGHQQPGSDSSCRGREQRNRADPGAGPK